MFRRLPVITQRVFLGNPLLELNSTILVEKSAIEIYVRTLKTKFFANGINQLKPVKQQNPNKFN
jgi:hypothetical protein